MRRRRPDVRFPSDETWDLVSLGRLQRHVMPVRPLLDGSSAVVAALLKRRWRETGGTPSRPDHSGGLRAPLRASHTSSTLLSAATLSSKAKQALSRVDLFRVIGVQAQQAETMALAAAVPGVPSARVKAAVAAADEAFDAFRAADKEAAAVVAAAAVAGAAADADAAAATAAAQAADTVAAEAEEASPGLAIHFSPLSDFG